jgi:hypothetical protein
MSDGMVVGPNQKVIFSKLTLTAGDEDIKVKDINVEYTGTSNRSAISKVLLLDSAMLEIDNDTIDSDDEAKLDADITVKDGETATVYIAAIMNSTLTANDGLEVSIKVISITTDGADVEGDSIKGAAHVAKNNISNNSFDVSINMEDKNVKIGEQNIEVAEVTVKNESSDTDDEYVISMKLERTGSAGDDTIEDLKITANGKTYKATVDPTDNDKYVFNFGSGVKVEDKRDTDFNVIVSVKEDTGKTFAFKIVDLVVKDEDGVILSDSNGTTDYTDSSNDGITIQDTEIKFSKTTDVDGGNVAAGSKSVELASFEYEVTGEDLEGDLYVVLKVNGATYIDIKDADVENVAIYTKGGDRISDREDTSFSSLDNPLTGETKIPTESANVEVATGIYYYSVKFDDFKFKNSDGDSVDYVIKGDIDKDALSKTTYSVIGYQYKSIKTSNGEDVSDIQKNVTGEEQKVESAALEVKIQNADDTDINADKNDQEVAEVKLDASNSGDNVRVKELKIKYTTSGTTAIANVQNCELYDGSKSVSSSIDANATSMKYNVDIVVTKDTTKTLVMKCDIKANSTGSVKFESFDTTSNTTYSFEGEGVDTDKNIDGDITGTSTATIAGGSATMKVSTDNKNNNKVVRKTDYDVVFAHYDFKAKNRELEIDNLTVTFDKNVDTIIDGKLDVYINGNKTSVNVDSADKKVFKFTNLNEKVAKDTTISVEFKGDVQTTGTIHIDQVVATTEEDVTPVVSGKAPEVQIVTALPTVTKLDVDISNLSTTNDVTLFAYKVKAEGGDVTMKNTVFNVDVTNVTLANVKVKVYDNASMNGSAQKEISDSNTVTEGTQLLTEDGKFDAALATTISGGDTYYVFLVGDVTTSNETRSVRVTVEDKTYTANTAGFDFSTPSLAGNLLVVDDMKSLLKKD